MRGVAHFEQTADPRQDAFRARKWVEVQIDEPRPAAVVPRPREVAAADEFLESWRTQRKRAHALLRELQENGNTVNDLRALLAAVREQHRRAASDSSDGAQWIVLDVKRSATTIELGGGSFCDWEASWCHADDETRHNRHLDHGQSEPRRQNLLSDQQDDEETFCVDDLEVSGLYVSAIGADGEFASPSFTPVELCY